MSALPKLILQKSTIRYECLQNMLTVLSMPAKKEDLSDWWQFLLTESTPYKMLEEPV